MFDYHMQSAMSYDTDSDAGAMALQALAMGLKEICFTDHIDYSRCIPHGEISFRADDYRRYYRDLGVPGLRIRHGVELGLTEHNVREADAELRRYPYDFVIGSIHHVDDLDIYLPEYWADKTPEQAERRYFETMLSCVRRHDAFDVLGHITYIAKSPSNPRRRVISYEDYPEYFDEILKILVAKGKGIEINTSGMDIAGDFLPGEAFLRRFKELGGRLVTVGSDAHAPERVGRHIPEALSMLREIFGYVCTFEGRRPIFHPL